jgi:RNA polymerase sigma-70 factor (TIGR02943 family)
MSSRVSKSVLKKIEDYAGAQNCAVHREYLFYYALGRLRDRDRAEDAVQDTLLAALASNGSFSGNSSLRTWLTGILNHKIYDQIRHTSRDRALCQGLFCDDEQQWEPAALASMGRSSRDPRSELECKELREALDEAIQELPGRMGLIYQLYEKEDWSGPQICQMLEISSRNLWIVLHRARRRLREALSHWWTNDQNGNRSRSDGKSP